MINTHLRGKVWRRKDRREADTIKSRKAGSIKEGEGEKGQVETERTVCGNKVTTTQKNN